MLSTMGAFIGGLGLFLLAINMITNGLKVAAGDALRELLARSTATTARGIGSGILFTALVQSSSAVTVATIGFVNAGLMGLGGALSVVYGANVGTTVTSWLVAVVGFKFQIQLYALPVVGIGMLLRVFGGSSRWSAVGEALAGFGLFFIGVAVLQEGFADAVEQFDLSRLAIAGPLGVLVYVLVGATMTVLTQSSSAAIAITLTAATGGLLTIDAAAAMVIGASVGTTSTAAFAVIGATPNAKRVAAGHVMFNVVTATVALLILPLMLLLVARTGDWLQLAAAPAVTLALFHTLFKLLGVALFWPLNARVAQFLRRRFRSASEDLGTPRHLDRHVATTPALALDALTLELKRTLALSVATLQQGLLGRHPRELQTRREAVQNLLSETSTFLERLERNALPDSVTGALPGVLRLVNYLEEVEQLTGELLQRQATLTGIPELTELTRFRQAVTTLLHAADPEAETFDPDAMAYHQQHLTLAWRALKDDILSQAAAGRLSVQRASTLIDTLRNAQQAALQVGKAALRLQALLAAQSHPVDAQATPETEAAKEAGH